MKSTYMFRDQVNIVTNWFQSWNECEQTVALYSLLRKITPTQAKFLIQVLEQGLQDCTAVQLTENQANSPTYISSLCNESKEHAVSMLLACLPLLRPGSTEAKAEYLKIIPKILSHSIDNGCHIEESRQLLSYSLIHPAISASERAQFTLWLGHLEERFAASQTNNGICGQTPGHQDIYGQYSNQGSKNAITNVGGFTQNLMQGMSSQGSGWMEKRDSGIIGDALPAAEQRGSPSSSMLGSVPPSGPRAITSSSACPLNHLADFAQNANQGNGYTHVPLHSTLSGPPAFSVPLQGNHGLVSNGHRRLTRSSSVTPPITAPGSNVPEWLNRHHEEMARSSQSSTNSEPHAPLSPQSSITSSGSGSDIHQEDQHNQRNTFLEEGTGMRDVPIWLKSLRLHKYAYLFQMMEYEEMMALSEDWLEAQNVTKGARNKIILSIKKLRERPNLLRTMEKEIIETGNMKQALSEVKGMLNTPIKASATSTGTEATSGEENKENAGAGPQDGEIPEGDLPGQITRVLGKVCTQLLVLGRPEDEAFSMYLQLLDKCLMHEGFSVEQKRKLSSWKQQVQKIWHPQPQKYNLDRQRKSFGGSNTFPLNNLLRGGVGPSRALRGQQPAKWAFTANRQSMPLPGAALPAAGMPLYRNNSFNTAYNARPAMMEVGRPVMKHPVTRTHSAPIKSSHFGLGFSQKPMADMNMTEPDINASLDSLCLSMTEHALGSLGESLWPPSCSQL